MPRRREVTKREILPDPKFNSVQVARFINSLLRKGKKSTAEGIMYGAFDLIEQKTKENPLEVFEKAFDNVKPVIEVKSRRVGGATYQVPTEVPARRRNSWRSVGSSTAPSRVRKRPCSRSWPGNSSTPPTAGGPPSRKRRHP